MHPTFNHSVRRWSRTLLGRLFITFCLFSYNLSMVAFAIPNNGAAQHSNENNTPPSIAVTSSDLGFVGPFSFGAGYGTLNQFSFNAQYTKKINEYFGLSALAEYGDQTYRFGGTLGFKLSEHDLFKLSAERFNQLLPFSFSSGNVEERMSQNAYGARFRHALNHSIVKEIDVGAYYANAPSDTLDPVIFSDDEVSFINYRHLAGATSKGIDASTELQITPSTGVSAQLYYDDVHYHTKYAASTSHESQGLGGGLGVKQLLSERVVVSAVGSLRKLYNTYTAGISWLPGFLSGGEVSLLGQRIITHNDTPNSSIVGLQFGYDFGIGGGGARYALSSLVVTQDVGEWVATPAVYMDQVLAITDEKTELLSSVSSMSTMSEAFASRFSALSPASGPVEGGTSVEIAVDDTSDVVGVKFGDLEATAFTVSSATQLTAVSPAAQAGPVDVTLIKSAEKNLVYIDQFTYEVPVIDAAAPAVSSVAPNAGPLAGGTTVVIKGTAFTGATAVKFGTTDAKSFTVNSATQITVVSPPGSGGIINITVTTPSGTSTTGTANQFTYQDLPTITSISPIVGTPSGGTTVTVNGTNFLGASAVQFGGKAGTSVTVVTPTQLTVKSPSGLAGSTVDITVTTLSGTSSTSSADQFTYETAPTVTALSPNVGPLSGGNTIVLTGTNFIGATAVKFGTTAATSFTVDSATQITAVAPVRTAGTVNVTVTTPLGTSATATGNQFIYQTAPTVTSLSPTVGVATGGTTVVITGTNFTGTTAVKFGTTDATSFVINSATKITAVSPAVSASTVNVTVTTPAGTSAMAAANQFTFQAAPTVTSLSPNAGLPAGGTTVVITGTSFINVTAVKFGATNASSYTVDSASQITAVSPAGTAGTVNVTVTTSMGTSPTDTGNQYTYEGVPTITSMSPSTGLPSGGSTVVITGTNFTNTLGISFGSAFVSSYTVNSPTQITLIVPANTAGTVNVRVTTPVGTTAINSAAQYVYQDAPTVTQVYPNAGLPAGGTSVVITGTSFTNASAVKFNGTNAASFTVNTATQITAVSPAGVQGNTADITVTTPVGTSAITSADQFTYEGAPTITAISPNAGLPAGGTTVVITGTNFTGAAAVNFGAAFASSFTVDSPTQITAVSPAGVAGTTNIRVTTGVATSVIVPAAQYAYEGVPSVTAIVPNAGLPAGGTTVVITGANFTNATAVKFGTTNAASFTVNTATQITAVSPAGVSGSTVDIKVITPVGTSVITSSDQYTYEDVPTVTALSPSAGLPAGGTTVVITGTNFLDASAVKFGTTNATSYTINSGTQITAVSPAGTGTVNVTVTTPLGTSATSGANQFTYEGVPTIASVSPNAGLPAGGTAVTINGTNLLGATAVKFGTVNASSFTVNSGTQITAVSPAGVQGSAVDITVTTPVGTSSVSSSDTFIYEGMPTITGMTPNAGVPAGGTTVVITGTNFTNTLGISFGSAFAPSYTVNSPTQITLVTPANVAGVANVRVTTPVGTTALTPAGQYVYEEAPAISQVYPNAGLPAGGTNVIITGTNFTNASAVTFGGTNATSFIVNTPTQITAVSPAGTQGSMVDIRVTTPVGTSTVTSADQFVYEGVPTITGISPNAGVLAGGTSVVITGTNFTDSVAINFGTTFAPNFTVDSPTQITVISPAGSSGITNVRVTTPVGTSMIVPAAQYAYEDTPVVSSLSVSGGVPAGGSTVVITGNNFNYATAVKFGSTNATSFTVNSATQITAVSPAGTSGQTVDVTVTTPVGTSATSSADQFIYEDAPTVTNVNPNAGLPAGGTSVVIMGTNFLGATAVKFGTKNAVSFTIHSARQISAVAPAGTGTVEVTVTTPSGSSVISSVEQMGTDSLYTYQGEPTLTSISPNAGLPAGGTLVTLNGTNLSHATAVNFGATAATSFTVVSATQITAVSPAGIQGSAVDITVTTPVGTTVTSAADQFIYEGVPTITSMTPNAGVLAGGTTVVITGTNFTNTLGISFGAAFAPSFTVDSPTQITLVTPANIAGVANVRVTTPVGTTDLSPAAQYVYEEAPTITRVYPNAGLPVGGTTVVITGTNFLDATAVKFGGVNAARFSINSPTQITAVSPAGTQGETADVTVTTPVGTSVISSADTFFYEGYPAITAISPNAGLPAGGTTVVITGTNFTNTVAVNFGTNFAASFTVDSPTQITAISPAGSVGVANVRVTTPVGTSMIVPAAEYVYEGVPSVTGVSPSAGLPAGGATVVISGTNFTQATAVKFGLTDATSFTVNSPTQITAIAPAGSQGDVVNITVTTPVGTSASSSADEFIYEAAPTVTGLSPNAGLPSGGTVVVITGTDFLDATAVQFGSNNADSFTVNSATQITAVSPTGSGVVNVTVTTPSGTSSVSSANEFVYEGTPTVTGLSPQLGIPSGGTTVVISGTNFLDATEVLFGTDPASSFTIDSASQITAVSPAGNGTVNVSVSTPVGTSGVSSMSEYTYQGPPTLASISPNAGLPAGGTLVTLNGTNLSRATAVNFGGTPATSFTVVSPTQITAISPAGTQGNSVDITVTTPIGTTPTSPVDQFVYEGVPTITSMTPNAGVLAGGTTVVITGTNFTNALGISFGAAFAPSYTVDSPTQITLVTPANVGGIANVRVTTPVGTTGLSPAAQYVYEEAPTVTRVYPNAGLPVGGTTVVITGTNFLDATAVKFGGVDAARFTINSPTQITAVSPAGTQGEIADVTVTTPVGTSTVSSADQFVYEDYPAISAISPNAGLPAGGTTVVITGTNFTNDIAVTFGTTFANDFRVDSATQITVISPPGTTGMANIRVTTPVGTSVIVPAARYAYEEAPVVTNVSPNAGLPEGGSSVVISGANFMNTAAVKFGTTDATSFTVNSPTQITAIAPAGTQGSAVDITVTTPVGISSISSADQYIYEVAPTVTGLSPNAGLPTGGTTVVLSGTDFLSATAVQFGGENAASFTVNSATQITAVSPAGSGAMNVTVSTPSGTSMATLANTFVYEETPTISNISPNAGLPVGGTVVTLNGTNLANATAVNFGATPATSFTVVSPTQITAVSPAGTQGGAVDITVTTPVGTTPVTSADQFIYEGVPTITAMTPNAGVLAGGTTVVITGTNFTNTLGISFGAAFAPSFTVDSPTQITLVTPANVAGPVNVRVTTPVATTALTPVGQYVYEEAPTISQIYPNAGLPSGGTRVIVTGTNFTKATAVKFAGVNAASFIVNSPTQITAFSPAGTQGQSADVTVTTPVGTSVISSADAFVYEGYPSITGISPNAGVPAGGTPVVITGINFTNDIAVTFGTTFANDFTVDSATQITVISPPGATGMANVRVTTPVGTSVIVPAAQYAYEEPPVISEISPVAGIPMGGTTVILTGANFNHATAVNFGGTSAASFTINTPTQITAVSPAGIQGQTVDITVTTPVGTSVISSADQYLYEEAPTVTRISPTVGAPAGGSTIVITGTNFLDAIAVEFGSVDATSFTIDSPTQITAIAPAGVGEVTVSVTTPSGTSPFGLSNQFTYEGIPVINHISPNAGQPAGGNVVIIQGTNFLGATGVSFGGTAAARFTVNSANQITAISPAGSQGSVADITVTTPVGTSAITSADQFAYEGVPTITAMTPNAGLPTGGTTVVITGANFTNALSVSFGTTFASSFTVDSPTQITAVAPRNSSGAKKLGGNTNVRVTTAVGTSAVTPVAQYVYEEVPNVSGVSPTVGLAAGGTTVVISGTNFANATAVNFGSTAATSFIVNSATTITAIAPAGTEGSMVDIEVVTPVGVSANSSADQFEYEELPTVTHVSPNMGSTEGGETVVITGAHFVGELMVNFGDAFAADFTVDSATQITAVVPSHAPGTVNIRITTGVGTSVATIASHYTYQDLPVVMNISPNAGIPAGGTSVVITGQNFTDVMGVNFGDTPAASFVVDSSTQITAISPPGAPDSVVHVTVETDAGISATSSNDLFTYDPPIVTGLAPTHGPSVGGTTVVITGIDFNSVISVKFGALDASSYTVDSPTQITAVAPAGKSGKKVNIEVITAFGISPNTSSSQYTYENDLPESLWPTASPSSLDANSSMIMPASAARKLRTTIVTASQHETQKRALEDWLFQDVMLEQEINQTLQQPY